MPFSSLNDPADLARASAAMEAIWSEVADDIPLNKRERERARLAYIVANCTLLAIDEDDLRRNARLQFGELPATDL